MFHYSHEKANEMKNWIDFYSNEISFERKSAIQQYVNELDMLNVLQYNTQYLFTKVANDKQNKNFTYDLYELGIATVGKIKLWLKFDDFRKSILDVCALPFVR